MKTVCKRGHSLLDQTNVYVDPDGANNCRQCGRDARAAYKKRKQLEAAYILPSLEVLAEYAMAGGFNDLSGH